MSSQAPQKAPKSNNRIDLLREYRNWSSPNHSYAESLQEYSEYPSKSLWLQACHQAVRDENRAWLENPPLASSYPRVADRDRKNTARFIANCALKALASKQAGDSNTTNEIDYRNIGGLKEAHQSEESAKDLIQYFASEKRPIEGKTAAVKVLLAGNEGKLGQLEIEKIPNGDGKIFPDPAFMAFSRFEPDFEESIKDALKYITDTERLGEAQTYNYRWRLFDRSNTKKDDSNFRVLDQPLRGSSMGFASALAFRQLFKPLKFSLAKYAFTGEIDENGVLKSVGEYPSKLQAGKNFTIYFPDVDQEEIKHYREDGYSIKEAVTIKDAIAEIKNKNRKEKLIFAGIVVGITAVIILLAASVYAWRASSLEAENEKHQKELFSRQYELKEQEGKVKDQQLELEKQQKAFAQEDAETQRQKRLNEENKRKNAEKEAQLAEEREALAKQESKVLAQKNVQLDAAKQVAEKNEKEAQRQKGVAEKNEETANAYRQVAKANQLAYQGLAALNDKDYVSAKLYFSESLSFNDTPFARSGLLNATFANPLNQKYRWTLELSTRSWDTDFQAVAGAAFYRLDLERTGQFFAYLSNEKEISFRKVETNEEIEKINVNDKYLSAFSISPGGKYLAIGTSDGNLVLRNNLTKESDILLAIETSEVEAKNKMFTALAFNSDGSYLAVATGKKEILIISLSDKKVINSFPKKKKTDAEEESDFDKAVVSLVFNSSTGLAFSTIDESSNSQIGFIPDISSNFIFTTAEDEPIIKISFINDNQLLSSGIGWKMWSIKENKIKEGSSESIATWPQTFAVSNQNFNFFLSLGEDGKLKFWSSENQRLMTQFSQGIGKPIQLALADNGTLLLESVDRHRKVKIFRWDLNENKNNQLIASSVIDETNPQLTAYNGRYVSFNCSKRLLEIKDFFTKKSILSVQYDTSSNLGLLILTPRLNQTGTHLLIKSEEHEKVKNTENYTIKEKLRLYDLSSLQITDIDISQYREITPKVLSPGNISNFCPNGLQSTIVTPDDKEYLSNDGKQVALLTKDNSIAIFSADDFSQPISVISNKINSGVPLPENAKFSTGFSISPNNQTLIRSAPTIQEILKKRQNADSLNFEASSHYNFEFYDIQTGKLKQVIPASDGLSGFDLSFDGKVFAMTDVRGYVYLWKLDPYRRLEKVLKVGSYESVISPTFSQDNKYLAWTSSGTGRIHFYDIEKQKPLADWQTGELVGAVNFVAKDKLSLLTFRGLSTIDFSSFPALSGGDANSITKLITSQTNISLGSSQEPGKFYKQTELNSILEANKYKNDAPKFRFHSEQSDQYSTVDNDFSVYENGKVDNRSDGFNCNPIFDHPIFNPYPLTFKSPAESCSHYPLIDIREAEGGTKYGRYAESLQDWEAIRKINTEKLYYGLLYVSNGAANNLSPQTDIHNAKVRVTITPQQDNSYTVEAVLSADNTASISGHLVLQTETDKRIEVGDVIQIFNYLGQFPPIRTFNKSDVLQNNDHKTVLEIPISDIKPGFETDLFIRFNFMAK